MTSGSFQSSETQPIQYVLANYRTCFMSSEFRYKASLVLNAILVIAAVALVMPGTKPEPAAAIEASPAETIKSAPTTIERKTPQYPAAAPAQDQRRWLVDQLRAMGVPNNVLARVVWADLDWKWNQRGGELSLKTHGDPDTMAAYKLQNAMSLDDEMRAALGEEGFNAWDRDNMLREANRGKIALTPSESEAAYGLWKKMQQWELELRKAKLNGQMDEADISEAFEKSISEFNDQMKSLLGDERWAKARQIDDGTDSLRRDFAKANPTDAQFQELLKTQQQWNDQRAALDKQSPDASSAATRSKSKRWMRRATRNIGGCWVLMRSTRFKKSRTSATRK